MSASRHDDSHPQDGPPPKRQKISTNDTKVIREIDLPSISKTRMSGTRSISAKARKSLQPMPTWATPSRTIRNPFSASQASTSSYVTTPSASPKSPLEFKRHARPSAGPSISKAPAKGQFYVAAPSISRLNDSLSVKKSVLSAPVIKSSRSITTPNVPTLPKAPTASTSKAFDLASQIMSASTANASISRTTSMTSPSQTKSLTTRKSTPKPEKKSVPKPPSPKPTFSFKEKEKARIVTNEVVPTSDDEEMELDQDSVIVLGNLEEVATRKCSHKSCRILVPLDSKFRLCDGCRANTRERSRRRKREERQNSILQAALNPIPPLPPKLPQQGVIPSSTEPIPTPPPPPSSTSGQEGTPVSQDIHLSDGTNMTPALSIPSSSEPPPLFKTWMENLRRSGRVPSVGGRPLKPGARSRHESSTGYYFQDRDSWLAGVSSHMREVRRLGYLKSPSFIGYYIVISGPTTESFIHDSNVVTQELVLKTGIAIMYVTCHIPILLSAYLITHRPFGSSTIIPNQWGYSVQFACGCAEHPGAPRRDGGSTCNGHITLHIQKVQIRFDFGMVTADQVILRIEHRHR